ncbi:Gmad2 immunoglobulin-like domain-containing protein [Cellulomonas septica]|uniref:Bacterial spore germination immunoglobulin-like domain-containing protein n=1 Tax=Cellulomonas septica TaxID=285080 RepID=A0ABX1JUT0_9CELL|nr:hypothetical protein [Cellulomonas septica]
MGVVVDAPRPGAVVAGPDVDVRGSGTAFEGTLRWRVTSGDAVVDEGYTTAGANGLVGPFGFTLALDTGIYTLEVWEPGMSEDGAATGAVPGGQTAVRTTFAVVRACTDLA